MSILALAAMEKLMRKSGAKRVSESSKEALKKLLEDYADKICSRAVQLAKHGGRTTVKAEDIELSAKTQ